MTTFMIVCPLVFLAGFVDALAGGGGLISLPAYMFAGLPTHAAIATNKLSSSMGTAIATVHYWKKGFMKWKICLPGILTAFAGSWCGARLNLFMNERVLQIMMLVLLPFIAFYVLRSKALTKVSAQEYPLRKTIILCSLISFGIGIYDGIYGPGTGTFLMLLFTGVCHLSLEDSAGTTKAINLTTNVAALTVYLMHGAILIPLGLAAGCCNMLGNYLGSHCFTSKGAKFVEPVLLIVLLIFFIRVSFQVAGV
ncbi:MAG: sulfite exporter TauE/SafE family protein [Clostridia bacterium]|nr:sulfite exporter TauE/SafE family protein [Clostridia bacterium]NCC42987.1 sulfite exporter TauE/SafE family protein [Clostridia bacterium]